MYWLIDYNLLQFISLSEVRKLVVRGSEQEEKDLNIKTTFIFTPFGIKGVFLISRLH